jgi:hypothetical protein
VNASCHVRRDITAALGLDAPEGVAGDCMLDGWLPIPSPGRELGWSAERAGQGDPPGYRQVLTEDRRRRLVGERGRELPGSSSTCPQPLAPLLQHGVQQPGRRRGLPRTQERGRVTRYPL